MFLKIVTRGGHSAFIISQLANDKVKYHQGHT